MAVEAEADIEEDGAAVQPAKRGIPKKLIIFGAAGLIVLLAAGAGLYFFVFAGRGEDEAARAAALAVPETFIFNLPPMTVNLNDEDTESDSFMKLTIALEVENEGVMREIQPRMAKVVDAFQVYLRELRKSDLEGQPASIALRKSCAAA